MKTYIVDWFNKTRNGAIRTYRKAVETDNLEKFVREKMKLTMVGAFFGQYKGAFGCATEVEETSKFGYVYTTVKGGEYWFVTGGKLTCGKSKWKNYYDYKLKAWKTPDCI